ncbi:MAG TPA: alpha/beta fold hydrolase [Polyangiaceae bacterium]
MADVLLVHGAWHGPWCWRGFAERLTERGHRVRAALLRDHDRAGGKIWHRVSDYVVDVQQAAREFAQPPLLVGHSLGGLVVQKYLERQPAPGAVLMASLPPGGSLPVCWRLLRRHPRTFLSANLQLSLRPFIMDEELVRELFLSPDRPIELARQLMTRLRDESYLAFIDTILFALPRPSCVRAPVLVLGAERDGFLTVSDIERTARAYGTKAEIFPRIGHDMMLDAGWELVADRVAAWAADIDTTNRAAVG